MRIGIDMRMAGSGEGIGRYIEELAEHLAKIDKMNDYFLLYAKDQNPKSQIPNPKFCFIKASSPYYSWAEQTKFIWELKRLNLDLAHFASFNVPIFYPGKFVITIHDIIHHLYPGKKKSRFFHRLAYRLVISQAVKRAKKVIAVSENTKKDIIKTFKTNPNKIEVIYEGVNKRFCKKETDEKIKHIKQKYNISKPYLFFIGVWRQYKNLPRLALAFDILKEEYDLDCQLVLAGKIDPFYPEIKEAIFGIKNKADVRALGFVPDEDLPALYQGADIFVLPSVIEGFGLIGVEAQASGIPVAASKIPVLEEILGNGAVYFDPTNPAEIASTVESVAEDEKMRQSLILFGKENTERFSWIDAAKTTLDLYKKYERTNY
jgi:glycosyltransferase involved in cell wall biosynthesis